MNEFESLLLSGRTCLAEASIYERLRRRTDLPFDENLAHGALLLQDAGRAALLEVHREYIEVARDAGLPIALLTDTWRLSRSRLRRSGLAHEALNRRNVELLLPLKGPGIFVGGLLGPAWDAYRPAEALAAEAALEEHSAQAQVLADAGADFLLAATLPALSEAIGLALAMSATNLPYLLSFVIRPNGTLLDGTPFREAIQAIEASVERAPYFAINCVHPSVLAQAARAEPAIGQVRWFQANASALPPEELDGAETVLQDEPEPFARQMIEVATSLKISVVGGCCGTDARHLREIAKRLASSD